MSVPVRCGWCSADPLYQAYHDHEWGIPSHDRQHLFELLCLEGQQAGLSWITVLKKRQRYREQFFNFDPAQVAELSDAELAEKCQDAGLIRHLGKLTAIRDNARAWIQQEQAGVQMSEWLWQFVDGQPILNAWSDYREAPTQTPASQAMSKALKKKGFRFVGATTCYAFMQAVGMVNDHTTDCHCYPQSQ
ncbi:MAG: DNA-3-methyladenine glycosylase I [Pseudomonadota bacterium]|nr:DNA-3-methyladenine glycosylase I [Pseudomonadota bacterium]